MEDETDYESDSAVLRSDAPVPLFCLWNTLLDRGLAPEVVDLMEETVLEAHLQGGFGSARMSVTVGLGELVGLIEILRELTSLRTLQTDWKTYDGTLEIRLNVQMDRTGPPVLCEVWLRDSLLIQREGISVQEEYHCRIQTNLSWITLFLADLERLAYRYRYVQILLDPI